MFNRLFARQVKYQTALDGSPDTLSDLECDKLVNQNIYDMMEECVEARQHIHSRKGWNAEKSAKPMTKEERLECATEIIDVIFFAFNALFYLRFNFIEVCGILNSKISENDTRLDHKKFEESEVKELASVK